MNSNFYRITTRLVNIIFQAPHSLTINNRDESKFFIFAKKAFILAVDISIDLYFAFKLHLHSTVKHFFNWIPS